MEPNPFNINPVSPVEPPPPPPPQPRRRSIVTPVILILIGVAFLLSNFNLVTFDIWEMVVKLWPVWLIAVGLDMMLGRRTAWGSWLVLGLVVSIIAGAVWVGNLGIYFGTSYGGPAERVAISADATGVKRATVEINSSVGEFRLDSTSNDALLVDGYVNRLNGERLQESYTGSNGDVTFILKSQGVGLPAVNTTHNGGRWDLKLNKNIPMDLKLGTGIGQSSIDLSDLTLTRLEVRTGIGQVELTLPEKGNFSVDVSSGIGQTTLRVPKGMEARIRATKGIGALNVSGDFNRQDNYWVTPKFSSAANRVEVEINGGIGEIRIQH